MHVVIAKVSEVFFDGEAYSMTVPATAGDMTVLGEHMPLITTLKPGTISIRETAGASPKEIEVEGGVMEVRHDGATVIL
ncbi:MAG TPA: F0F1 ATP synthase subunit epsilon [Candidatus Paceibacterota bacterium]|nr:F0F1 ATP synthase subunit epsilon [Candidatus Paceibacterota bacterium]